MFQMTREFERGAETENGHQPVQVNPPEPLGVLSSTAFGRSFSYQFTADDVLWTARFLVGEAGGRDDSGNRAVLWAMFNRYALFTHQVYPTFQQFIRAYSTPLQPVLKNAGAARRHMDQPTFVRTGGMYPGTTVPRGQLRRHLQLQSMSWMQLPAAARSLAERALNGQIPNVIGNASEFGSTHVYFHDRYRRYPNQEEWQRFTESYAQQKRWRWIGAVPGLNQRGNAFFVDHRAVSLPPNVVRVIQPQRESESLEVFTPFRQTVRFRSRVLTYTTKDVIDKRISIPAQHALVRLSKNPRTNAAAVGLLNEVKSQRLAGISCVNWQKAAQRAVKLGKSWWTVIPRGEDAILLLDPANPLAGQPLIAFRRELDPDCGLLKGEKRYAASPARLDAALLKVWSSLRRMRRGRPRLCSFRRSGPIEAETPFTCIANIIPPIIAQIVPRLARRRLRDITADKTQYIDSGNQSGRALVAPKSHHAYCDAAGRGALPLLPVLSSDENACGMDRLRTTRVEIPDALRGRLAVFCANAKDAAADPPGLFMVWIPDNLDAEKVSSVIDFHVSLHAQPSGATASYPLGIETASNGKKFQPYIDKGYAQIMWRTWGHLQHDMAQRACVYVAPIAPDDRMFTQLTGTKLVAWLQEVAELVRERLMSGPRTPVRIGRVALSGFSRGGSWVSVVLANPGGDSGAAFLRNNVKEVYMFDPAGDSPEAVRSWQANSSNSILRVYESRLSKYQVYKRLVETGRGQEIVRNFTGAPAGRARETNSAKGSVVLFPSSLLTSAGNCGTRNLGCAIPFSQDAHSWYVNFFMAHALNNSGFDRL